jgi:hypothetical protein
MQMGENSIPDLLLELISPFVRRHGSLAPQAFYLGFPLLCFAQCSEFETDYSSEQSKVSRDMRQWLNFLAE